MTPKASESSTESTSATQTRFTVALPKDVGAQIDALAARMAESMRKQYGIGVELSRAQVVTSVVQSALKTFEDVDSGSGEGGDES